MLVTRKSPRTGDINTLDLPITQEQIDRYNSGEYAQVAFSNLTTDQREFIMTGYTSEDWEAMFGTE